MKFPIIQTYPKHAPLVLPLFDREDFRNWLPKGISKDDHAIISSVINDEKLSGEYARKIPIANGKSSILLVGKGVQEKWNNRKARVLIRRIVQSVKMYRIKDPHLPVLSVSTEISPELLRMIATEVVAANYVFTLYKEMPKNGWTSLQQLKLYIPSKINITPQLKRALTEGGIIGEELNGARTLSNTPGGDMTPELLAKEALNVAMRTPSIKATIFDEFQMEELGMGGILGVAKGSVQRPKFIIVEYDALETATQPLILVGKGVTFDTGGLNLKPTQYINEMHMDMAGGAAVLHAISAIARLKMRIHVIGIVPAVENMPSGSSYRPGDILKTITGKTIEVINTDAEGRIILADALGYAARLSPKLVIDLATLTGASMIALGQRVSAVFSDDKDRENLLVTLGESTGDYLWPLPLWDEYADDIKGTFGDFVNATQRDSYGGAITAAQFLKQFTSYPWAHIDMAPTMTSIESDKLAKGAKGTGVKLFVELARHFEDRA